MSDEVSDDAHDMGPLPEVHPRHVPTAKAKNELESFVLELRDKYHLTFAELMYVLADTLHGWTSSVLSCERRKKGD